MIYLALATAVVTSLNSSSVLVVDLSLTFNLICRCGSRPLHPVR